MLVLGMLAARALSITIRKVGFPEGSGPPLFAAI